MSVVQAGIALRSALPADELGAVLERLFSDSIEELGQPFQHGFDIRRPGDVMVQLFGDAWFVCNLDLGLRALGDTGDSNGTAQGVHALLGGPELMMAFCHDEPGRRHGYALRVQGRLERRRWQGPAESQKARSPPAGDTLEQQGTPQAFERRWLQAPHYVENREATLGASRRMRYLGDRQIVVPESDLTARLLHDGLEALFGVCPWDTLITPSYRFFRALGRDGEPYAFEAERAPPRKRAWWRWPWR